MIRWQITIELGDAEPGRAEIETEINTFRQMLIDAHITHTFTNERAPAKTGRITFPAAGIDPAPTAAEAFPDDLIGRT